MIVRPAEPGWPPGDDYPDWLRGFLDDRDAEVEKKAAAVEADDPELAARLRGGQDRDSYPDAIRDWARNGADSAFVLTPEQVIEASTERGIDKSQGAAHFELANHFWGNGDRTSAITHFNEAHRLQPDNWTYKRQAWSLVGNEEAGGGEMGRFNQGPLPGAEAEWPFAGTFMSEAAATPAADYYPATMSPETTSPKAT